MSSCMEADVLMDSGRPYPVFQVVAHIAMVRKVGEHDVLRVGILLLRQPLHSLSRKGEQQGFRCLGYDNAGIPLAAGTGKVAPSQFLHIPVPEAAETAEKIGLFDPFPVTRGGDKPFHLINGEIFTPGFGHGNLVSRINLCHGILFQHPGADCGVQGRTEFALVSPCRHPVDRLAGPCTVVVTQIIYEHQAEILVHLRHPDIRRYRSQYPGHFGYYGRVLDTVSFLFADIGVHPFGKRHVRMEYGLVTGAAVSDSQQLQGTFPL